MSWKVGHFQTTTKKNIQKAVFFRKTKVQNATWNSGNGFHSGIKFRVAVLMMEGAKKLHPN